MIFPPLCGQVAMRLCNTACAAGIAFALSACGGNGDGTTRPDSAVIAHTVETRDQAPVQARALPADGAALNAQELEAAHAEAAALPANTALKALASGQTAPLAAYTSGLVAQKAALIQLPVYRFFNGRTGTHFYTSSTSERDSVQANLPTYSYEGQAFLAAGQAAVGMKPVYRFFNTQTGVHFYTISESERASIEANLPQFHLEGVAYYASQVAGAGFKPLYRFFLPNAGTHFYTASETERQQVQETLSSTYRFEGVGYYVLTGECIAGDTTSSACVAAAAAAQDVCAAWDGTFPANAFAVRDTDRASLQALLDTHGVLRLAPGDYRTGGPSKITIRSNQAIISLPSTSFPDVQVAAGANRVRLDGLKNLNVTFEPGEAIRYGCFKDLRYAQITVNGATVERNLFVALTNTNLKVDTSQRGRFSDNRFIKLNSHGGDTPIDLKGDSARQSGGNAFLLLDAQTPPSSAFSIEGQRSVSFVGVDLEAYNWNGQTSAPYAFRVRNTGSFRAAHGNGMTRVGTSTNPAFDIDADQVFMHNFTAPTASPTLRLGQSNQLLFSWRNQLSPSLIQDDAIGGLRFFAQENRDGGLAADLAFSQGSARVGGAMAAPAATTLGNYLTQPGAGAPWGIPSFGAIPDPTGPNWASGLAQKVDESAAIQALVNSQGVAYLEPRVYYVSKPIVLNRNQGLVGAGANKTAIVALSPSIDIVNLAWTGMSACETITGGFTLAELTLQGGRNGLRSNTAGTQINQAVITHVTFRNMANAGILVDGAYGWDNNVLSYVNYVDSAYGFLQQGQPNPGTACNSNGEWTSMSYMDKTVFYRNQFVRLGRAMVLTPTRANNLDGIVESSFEGSTGNAITLGSGNSAFLIASSRFVDNAGNPTVQGSTAVVNSSFVAGRGSSLLSTGISVEGSSFAAGTASNATVFGYVAPGDVRNPSFFDVSNSTLGIPLGAVDTSTPVAGLYFNNTTLSSDRFNRLFTVLEYLTQGTPWATDDTRTVVPLMSGTAAPGSQLLFGGSWAP